MEYGKYQSFLGVLTFAVKDDKLCQLVIEDLDVTISESHIIKDIGNQLERYFKGELKNFSIPTTFNHGTSFQQEVWSRMLLIPYGKTISYHDIAIDIHRPKAVRAVGQACKRNPIGIVIPCHRVIGKNGHLTGYSGKHYLHLKDALLTMEKSYV